MKTWTLRFRKTDKSNFDEVRDGTKSVETRAASVRYQPIGTGDVLRFVCGEEEFSKRVKAKHHFPDIDSMLEEIPYSKIMPSADLIEEVKKIYSSYPNYNEKITKFGIFAFELE